MAITVKTYLDARNKSEDGAFPIKISINKNRKAAYLSTGIRVLPDEWNGYEVIKRRDRVRLNDFLDSLKLRVRNMVYDGRDAGRFIGMTAVEIKDALAREINGEREEDATPSFLSVYDKFAETRQSERTKEIYRVTGRKIRNLIPRAEKIKIVDVDLDWLEAFDEMLIAKGNNGSTRNIDFRNIRAVLKHAKKHKLITDDPFEDFDMPETSSPDRALTIEQLQTLLNAEVEPWEEKYRDFFLLSLLLIGMNTEDLLHQTKIEDGRITYNRSKTHKEISVKVEPEAQAILDKYRGKKYLLNVLDTYANTHNWTSKVDASLKAIAKRNGLPEVTMYWARHTWATLVHADLGVDINTVADALGHQPPRKVTLIYIKKRDYSRVDEANRKMIDYIFRNQ